MEVSINQWLAFAQRDGSRAHLVSVMPRAGITAFAGFVEWTLFPPKSERNALYDNHIITWKGHDWFAVSVPREALPEVADIAVALGLRIARHQPAVMIAGQATVVATIDPSLSKAELKTLLAKNGMPMFMVDALTEITSFPGPVHRVRAIENDEGNPVYKNRANETPEIMRREVELLSCLQHGDRPTPQQAAEFIYGPGVLRRGG